MFSLCTRKKKGGKQKKQKRQRARGAPLVPMALVDEQGAAVVVGETLGRWLEDGRSFYLAVGQNQWDPILG